MVKKNSVSSVCKTSSVVIFVLLFISGIVLGASTSFATTITVWISGFLFCLFLYAVGEIISQLYIANMISQQKQSPTEQLLEFAKLKDEGIITTEEFETKKFELLSKIQ